MIKPLKRNRDENPQLNWRFQQESSNGIALTRLGLK
jgi:hypothetical protein